ncbi:MAG TPA: copper resistance protein CopC [Jatrophihabitans sp.]|nr:copper resistance protein CopC [Jatrophihabitans sp.]
MCRRPAALAIALAGMLIMLVFAAPGASAHAYLSASNPADGASLAAAPSELQLNFSESVVLGATHLALTDSHGRNYPITGLRITSSSADGDTEEPVTVTGSLPELPHSAYRLNWATLSRDDLHRTSGVIVFGIGQSVLAAGEREPHPSRSEVLLRWVLFCGLALALGGVLAAELARRRAGEQPLVDRCARVSALGALGAATTAAALLLLQTRSSGVLTALGGRYGQGWLGREAGLLLLAGLMWARLGKAGRPAGWWRLLAAVAIAAIGVGSAVVGHNVNAGPSYVLADAAHLLAAAVWIGCPTCVLLAGRPERIRTVLRGFAWPATLCVAVLVATGLYLSSEAVVSVDAAVATFYGRTLLVKISLFLVVGLLGLINFRMLRRPVRALASRTVIAEVLAAVLVLGLAAVLTSSQPAREPQFVRASAPQTAGADAQVQDLQQTLSVKPNQPGKNVALIGLFDTRRPAPGQITRVTLEFVDSRGASSGAITAEPLPDNGWSAPVEIAAGGRSRVQLTVYRAGLAPVRSSFDWTVQSRTVARRTIISQAPIRSPLQKLAITALCLAATACLLGYRRGRRPRATSTGQPEPAAQPSALVSSGAR